MLGYVKIDKGELKVREYEIYTGYYCGVCKSIGRRYGQLPRMALSYDAAFLAIMLASLDPEPDKPVQEHCVGHRIKKKTIIRNQAVDYAADVMLILAWYKLLDDARDEGKLYAKATTVLLKRIFKKLRSRYPELCTAIEAHLASLSALEQAKCDSLDRAAEAFSMIMEVLFAEGVKVLYGKEALAEPQTPDAEEQPNDLKALDPFTEEPFSEAEGERPTPYQTLARIGYHMGKWIYLMDAVDDIEENLESGAYNPLIYRFQYSRKTETPEEFRARIEGDLRFNLFHYLAMVSNYTNSLAIQKNQGIIENVIYFGLHRKTEEILRRDQ